MGLGGRLIPIPQRSELSALKGEREATAQWLEVEAEGLRKVFMVLFK